MNSVKAWLHDRFPDQEETIQRLWGLDKGFEATSHELHQLELKLDKLNANNALIVVMEEDRNLALSARNVYGVGVCTVGQVDPVSLLRHEKVVITAEALKRFEESLA